MPPLRYFKVVGGGHTLPSHHKVQTRFYSRGKSMIGVEERLNVGKKQSFFPQKMVRLGSNWGHLIRLVSNNSESRKHHLFARIVLSYPRLSLSEYS